MTAVAVVFITVFMVFLPVYWRLDPKTGIAALAGVSAVTLTALSLESGVWLLMSTLLTHAGMKVGDRLGRKGAAVAVLAMFLAASLILLRDVPGLFWIGISYFTLRHIHVVMDWWTGKLGRPTLLTLIGYHLFLPTLAVGPIHRYENFEAEVRQRTWSADAFWTGAERALVGAFFAVVLGGWLTHRVSLATDDVFSVPFLREWLASLVYWVGLYFSFAGFTSVALGCALMAGLRLEENFNKPWLAKNLIEFWGRWHMSLSLWCRDYVFQPVAAFSRLPSLGVILSMLAMGLWHGTTAYWILWGVWQGLGLVLTRLALRANFRIKPAIARVFGFLTVLCWITISRPILVTLFGVDPP